MSKDRCPDVFSRQMEATAFTVLHAFFASRAVFKIKENHLDTYSPVIQSRDGLRAMSRERKKLMDYKADYGTSIKQLPNVVLRAKRCSRHYWFDFSYLRNSEM